MGIAKRANQPYPKARQTRHFGRPWWLSTEAECKYDATWEMHVDL